MAIEKHFFGDLELKTPKKPRQVHPKTWKEDYRSAFGVEHIANVADVPKGNNVIFVTSCTGNKSDLPRGTAEEMYLSQLNQRFYKAMKEAGVNYGTISGHLGIVFPDEVFEAYDSHTSEYQFEEQFMLMARNIEQKCREKGFDTIVFCYSSPLMSEPFIKRLSYTNMKVLYITKQSIVVDAHK